MDDQNVKTGVDSLIFVLEIHTLQTYLGMELIKRTLISHSLAAKNTLSINFFKCLFRAITQVPGVLIRRNMVDDMSHYIYTPADRRRKNIYKKTTGLPQNWSVKL